MQFAQAQLRFEQPHSPLKTGSERPTGNMDEQLHDYGTRYAAFTAASEELSAALPDCMLHWRKCGRFHDETDGVQGSESDSEGTDE